MSSHNVPPHNHSIDDLPVGIGPGKIPLWDSVFYETTESFVPGPTGSVVANPNATAAFCDTSTGALIFFMPPLRDGQRFTVRITDGMLPVQVTPLVAATGVNGTAGATFTIDPVLGLRSASFLGDGPTNTWWLVAEASG